MSPNLLPCAHCGSPAKFYLINDESDPDNGAEFVSCTNLLCGTSSALMTPCMESVKEQLAERWNTRQFAPSWVSCEKDMPPDDTPVLALCKGEIELAVRHWDHPSHEETYRAFQYWTDPLTETADWQDEDISFWIPLPPPPKP